MKHTIWWSGYSYLFIYVNLQDIQYNEVGNSTSIFYVIDLSGVCLRTFGDRLHAANPIIRLLIMVLTKSR